MTRQLLGIVLLTLAALGACSAPAPDVAVTGSTSTIAPAVATAAAPTPTRLTIPAIGVAHPLITTYLQADDQLEVPARADEVSWYRGSVVPGEPGPAVLLGHVNLHKVLGTFGRLDKLQPGDQVIVDRVSGGPLVFDVDRVETHRKDAFPTDAVFGNTTGPELRLITCGGTFDPAARSYESNVIVFARLRS